MKRLYLIALFSLALLFAGCGTYTVAPGADPVVVHAEQTLAVSRDTLDAFIQYDYAHADTEPAGVHAFAESIRRHAPDTFREARAILDAYQSAKTADNLGKLNTYLESIQALAAQAKANTM